MKKIVTVILTSLVFLTAGLHSISVSAKTIPVTPTITETVEPTYDIQPFITIDYFIVDRDSYAGEQIWHEGWSAGKYYRGYLPYTGRTGWLGLSGKYRYEGRLIVAPIAPTMLNSSP